MGSSDRAEHPDFAALRLAAIVDSSDDAIISKNLDGIIQTWNRGAERIFGYTAAEAIGRPIAMLIPPERPDEEPGILARIRRGERVDHYETVRIRKDGRRIDISVTISPIREANGRIVGASKIARDISDRKQAEREREELLACAEAARAEAEAANRAKDQFLTTLSHELRSPLNAVLGWAHVLRARRPADPTLQRAIDAIIRNAEQQKQLINDLLDLSSIAAGKLRLRVRPLDPAELLAAAVESIRPAAEAKGLRLVTNVPAAVDPVAGDPDRLQQVFRNLLANAVKFTPAGGHIEVGLEQAAAEAVVAIRDSGVGIAPDVLPHVFERFRQGDASMTRRHSGLGLGLALVRQLVELHGGSVHAASPGVDQGATFTVRLPALAVPLRAAGPEAARSDEDAARCSGLRVLVVDDEPDALGLLTALLGAGGAVVVGARSAEEGFRLFQRERPAVLVSDLAMPDADGYSLVRRIRALRPEEGGQVPAVALTAHVSAAIQAEAIQAGFDVYLTKPVDGDELVAAVARLAKRSAEVAGEAPPAEARAAEASPQRSGGHARARGGGPASRAARGGTQR
ncbi:MAG: PAS domain S-box protein [Candidatus Methylomirabilales bacterium]